MAAVTPTNLHMVSLGSAKLSIAHFTTGIISGTDHWATGMTDIFAAMPAYNRDVATSVGALCVWWSATSGEVYVNSPTNTNVTLWVISGLGQDVWNKPS